MIWLRFAGALLLAGACGGAGAALAARKRAAWLQVHTFCELLDFLHGGIRYQALPGTVLLARAAAEPRFAGLGLEGCRDLGAVPVPPALGAALASSAAQTFGELCTAPRLRACAALSRLGERCRERERELDRAASEAQRLYPRLALCAGLLLVLFLL